MAQTYTLNIAITDINGEVINKPEVTLKLDEKIVVNQQQKEGFISYKLVKAGIYTLEIRASGFEPLTKQIEIKSSVTNENISLAVKKVEVTLEVKEDNQQKSIDEMLGGFYTPAQIAALPNTPEEIKRELKRRYGDDVVILVDGFSNQIPDKSRIASIRVSQSSYDAEYHEIGSTYVLITTRVAEQSFGGSIGGEFNNQSLNARDSFSAIRLPQQRRFINYDLYGPLIKDRASFFLFGNNLREQNRASVAAQLPEGRQIIVPNTVEHLNSINTNINFNLSKQHTGKLSYEYIFSKISNLGIGQLTLPERASTFDRTTHTIQFSESGYFKNKYLNEFRLEWKTSDSRLTPNSEKTSINVLGAFNGGGAGNKDFNRESRLQINNNLLFGVKNHAIKIGGSLEINHLNRIYAGNQNGTYIFSSLNNYLNGLPSLYTQMIGERKSQIKLIRLGQFLQDDFRLKKGWGLSIGIRYEIQNNISDGNNFSPRLGVVWSPLKSGNLTFRAGGGIFYNWLDTFNLSFIQSHSADQPAEVIIVNPLQSNNPIQQQQQSYWVKADNLQNPEVIHSSLTFSYNLFKKHNLRGEYVYQKGLHQFRSRDTNSPLDGIRPNSEFGNINQIESSAIFIKNSFNLSLNGTFAKRFSYNTKYILGKIISESDSIFELPSNSRNLGLDRSFSNLDQRHRFSSSIYWQMNKQLAFALVYNLASPIPYTITTGFDNNQNSVFNDRPLGVERNSGRGSWSNQTDFGINWMFSFIDSKNKKKGTKTGVVSGNEIARSSGLTDEGKRFSLKFFISAKNIFNQNNLTNFVGVQTSPLFGQGTQARQPRRIEVGMRFNF